MDKKEGREKVNINLRKNVKLLGDIIYCITEFY